MIMIMNLLFADDEKKRQLRIVVVFVVAFLLWVKNLGPRYAVDHDCPWAVIGRNSRNGSWFNFTSNKLNCYMNKVNEAVFESEKSTKLRYSVYALIHEQL